MLSLEDINKSSCTKCISLPAGILSKSVEPAGFSFFARHEWHMSLDTSAGDVEILTAELFDECKNIAINYVDLFESHACLANSNQSKGALLEGCYSHRLKYDLAKSFLSQYSIQSNKTQSIEEEVERVLGVNFVNRGKTADRKVTSLVKKFSQNNQDIYSLLCVNETDSPAHIRKTYLKIAMILHPDKSANLKTSSIRGESKEDKFISDYIDKYKICTMSEEQKNKLFLTVQDAYAILSDESLRFEYECMMPFDESIPTMAQINNIGDNYYTFMSKYFDLNGKWSKTQPVPKFGNDDTNDEELDNFYIFWRNFDSKRVFCAHFPHPIEGTENREERRWMERENARIQKKMFKSDIIRIQKLVDIAQATDPRIRRRQQQKQQLKLQKKEEQLHKQREEKERILREEKLRLDRVRMELQEMKAKKQLIKKWKYHIKLILNSTQALDIDELSAHLANMDYNRLYKMMLNFLVVLQMNEVFAIYNGTDTLEYANAVKLFESTFPTINIDDEIRSKILKEWSVYQHGDSNVMDGDKDPGSNLTNDTCTSKNNNTCTKSNTGVSSNGSNEWSIHELSLLAKAIQVYPVGTADRWKLITNYIPSRSTKEIIKKANEVASGVTIAKVITGDNHSTSVGNDVVSTIATSVKVAEWSRDQQIAFEKALEANPPSSAPDQKTRWIKIAKSVPGKTPKECLDRFKQVNY